MKNFMDALLKFSRHKIVAQALCVLALVFLAACSRNVQKIEHKLSSNEDLLRTLEEQREEGNVTSFDISFDHASDESFREMAAFEGKFETRVLAVRAQLDGLLSDRANVSMAGNVKSLNASLRDSVPYKKLYDEVVVPYARYVINPTFTTNSLYTGDDRYRRMLDTFNRALVVVLEANPEFIAEKRILDVYWYGMSSTCLEGKRDPIQMTGNMCATALRFFGTDRNTSMILQYYASLLLPKLKVAYDAMVSIENNLGVDTQGTAEATGGRIPLEVEANPTYQAAKQIYGDIVKKYYRIIQISLKSRNSSIATSDASDLADVYFLKGAFYLDHFFDLQAQTASVRDARASYSNDFESILAKATSKVSDESYRDAFKEIICSMNFWTDYSRRRAGSNNWINSLFSLASAPSMRDAECEIPGGNGAKKNVIRLAAEEILTNADPFGQPGLLKNIAEMKSYSDGAALIRNLDADVDFEVSEELLLIDQLFREHWSVNEASIFWAGKEPRRVDKRRLMREAEKYLKFRLAKMIRRTNEFMGDVFSNKDNESTNETKFKEAIEDSQRLTTEWRSLKTQLKNVETFLHQVGRESDASQELPEFKRIERMFDNLEKNINLLAVYPNMLVLAFFMAKEKFSMKLQVWWFEITLDPSTVINWLFAQISQNPPRPWFDWGTDPSNARILKFENLYSVYYALKTNTFETIDAAFKKAGVSKEITATEFFKVMIERFLDTNRDYIKEFVEKKERAYKENSNYNNMISVCMEEAKALANPSYSPSYIKQIVTFKHLGSRTFLPFYTYGEENAKIVFDFYADKTTEQIRHVNGPLEHKLTFLNVMLGLLRTHWQSLEGQLPEGSAERAALVAKHLEDYEAIQAKYEEILSYKKRLYTVVTRVYGESHDCLEVLYGIERRQQWQMYGKIAQHLRKVHSRLAVIEALGAKEPELDENNADSVAAHEAWSAEMETLLAETRNELISQDPDLQLYKDDLGNVDGLGQPIRFYDEIQYQGGHAVYVSARWDFLTRASNWLERDINRNVSVKRVARENVNEDETYKDGNERKNKISIQFQADVESFINSGLREMDSKFLEYTEKGLDLKNFEARLELTYELYKAERYGVFADAIRRINEECAANPNSQGCLPELKISRRAMLNEVLDLADYISIDTNTQFVDTGRPTLETEEQIMRRLGLNRKFELVQEAGGYGGKKSLFLEVSSRKPAPFFDSFFKASVLSGDGFLYEAKDVVITLESLGSENENEKNSEGNTESENEAELSGRQNLDELIFLSKEDDIRKQSYKLYGQKVSGEFEVMLGLLTEVDLLEREDFEQGIVRDYVYEIDPANTDLEGSRSRLVMEMGRDGYPEYLNEARRNDLQTIISNFHRETRSRFKRKAE